MIAWFSLAVALLWGGAREAAAAPAEGTHAVWAPATPAPGATSLERSADERRDGSPAIVTPLADENEEERRAEERSEREYADVPSRAHPDTWTARLDAGEPQRFGRTLVTDPHPIHLDRIKPPPRA